MSNQKEQKPPLPPHPKPFTEKIEERQTKPIIPPQTKEEIVQQKENLKP